MRKVPIFELNLISEGFWEILAIVSVALNADYLLQALFEGLKDACGHLKFRPLTV